MKRETITISLFQKHDRVLTANGEATVLEDEVLESTDRYWLANNEIMVRLDETTGSQRVKDHSIEASNAILIKDKNDLN